jgi:hypothetical protein
LKTEASGATFRAPIRRSRAAGFLVGVACGLASLSAAALGGLLISLIGVEGAAVLTVVGALWFGLFFLSRPLQKRCARSLDSRRPGVALSEGLLAVPASDGSALIIRLGEPYRLTYGWWEYVAKGTGGPASNTRTVLTHATLSQGGVSLFFKAEDSVREAAAAGWPRGAFNEAAGRRHVRLWASDLVSLVEEIRSAGARASSASR